MANTSESTHVYTHGHHESVLRSHRTRTAANSAAYLLPYLRAGARLLDVGCGPGTITVDLARLVGPGHVTALEYAEAALEAARAEVARQEVRNIAFVTGDVHQLDFEDDTFDIVHAHQVLQHVHDPVQAIREMVRVCKPGGVVAARDGDYSGFTWHPGDEALDRWLALYDAAARANGGEPNAGRMLLAWAHAAGCRNVIASSSTWCYSDAPSREAWGGMWADRITESAVATQLIDMDAATDAELASVAAGWRSWAADPDGWISVLHGEILIAV
ncbi:MAG: methyltransferase domain-containing protein [Candidatus Nanopelagicales bacterium]